MSTAPSLAASTPEPPPVSLDEQPPVSLRALFAGYFVVGLTAFGFAMLYKIRALVRGHDWLSDEELDEGLALVQLYPGPLMVDFTAYIGYRLRGVPGALLAPFAFLLPSFVLMVGLSALYFGAGNQPWVHTLFLGLEAMVAGVLFNLTLDYGQRALRGRTEALIALASFVALTFKASPLLIVLAALALGAWLIAPAGAERVRLPQAAARPTPRRLAAIAAAVVAVLGVAGLAAALRSEAGRLALSFFKIGSLAFGSGMMLAPLIQAEVVDAHGWLSLSQFADGLALGQITPGPMLITAAFIGYKLGGIFAAALATYAVFAPSITMTLVFTEVFGHLRSIRPVRGALAGVLASFVGLLAGAALQLGAAGVRGPYLLALAGAAFCAVRFYKLDLLWVFLGGLAAWGALLALGIAA